MHIIEIGCSFMHICAGFLPSLLCFYGKAFFRLLRQERSQIGQTFECPGDRRSNSNYGTSRLFRLHQGGKQRDGYAHRLRMNFVITDVIDSYGLERSNAYMERHVSPGMSILC